MKKNAEDNPVKKVLDLYSAWNMDIAGPGCINAYFSYNITWEGKKWTLEGTFTADPDEFNFDWQDLGKINSRSCLKELVTRFISFFPGRVFTVVFKPYTIREDGECSCEKQ